MMGKLDVVTPIRRALKSEQTVMIVMAALVGAVAAVGAVLFRFMIAGAETMFWGSARGNLEAIAAMPWWLKLVLPALGGLLIAPIVVRFAPEARGSGIPEVIESVALHGGAVRARVAPLKALAAAVCIGSGGSAGREGPIVHIGASIGSLLGHWMSLSVKQVRTLVGCGAAGGIAATFNTPFAGALFAVEVVLGDLGSAKISPIVIASVVATVLSRRMTDDFPQIQVPDITNEVHPLSAGPYLMVGLACALLSAVFIKMLVHGWALAAKWKYSPYLLPAFGGLVVGAIGIALPHVYGVGYQTLNAVLNDELTIGLLLLVLVAKLVATAATLTTGGSGGVFAPSLFLGAVMGSIVGQFVQQYLPGLDVTPAVCALVGMGAVVAATTRAPISGVLMIFELTRDYDTIVPLMTACIPAVLISAVLHKDSIYIARLTSRGVTLRSRGELNLLRGLRVSDAMKKRVESVGPETPLSTLLDKLLENSAPLIWVSSADGRLRGAIPAHNLQIALVEREVLLELLVAQDVMNPVGVTVHPDDDLGMVMKLFDDGDHEILPVVDRATGRVVGDLHRGDIIEAYNQELAQRDVASTAVDAINLSDRVGGVELGDGYVLVEYEVPERLAGKTLVQLDVRRRVNAQVLLVKRKGARLVPGPDTTLAVGDTLLLAGQSHELEEKLPTL
jgi:CIC family chloride channel protein